MSADLLRLPVIGPFLRWKHARTTLQSILLLLAALVVVDGLFGPPTAPRNAAGTLPWVHWRGLVVLALLTVGNLFCMACPFMLPRRIAKRLFPARRAVPGWLRGKWLAVALLVLFFWSYEAFDLWASPWLTAWIVVGYFAGAFLVDAVFRGAAFCKHVCPIGQFNFVNSLVSPTEVRVRDADVCAECATKDCIRGRWEVDETGEPGLVQNGCELWLYQPRKVGNMDCTYCLDCIQACPWDNVGIELRTPGPELWTDPQRSGIGRFGRRPDLAALALVMSFGAFVNAFGMVAPVHDVGRWLSALPGLAHPTASVAFTFLCSLVVLPLLLVGGSALVSRKLGPLPGSVVEVATRFAWSVVPVGFGMWLAHYLFHFLLGGSSVLPVLLGRIPGLSSVTVGTWATGPIVPEAWLLPLQALLVEAGALGSIVVAYRIARREAADPPSARRAFVPWALLVILLSLVGIWLLTRPMEMRGMVGG